MNHILLLLCVNISIYSIPFDDVQKVPDLEMYEQNIDPKNAEKNVFEVYEIGFATGYALGYLHKTNNDPFNVIVNSVYVGFELNSIFNIDQKYGIFQLSFEPFFNVIKQPKLNVEVGISAFIKYEYSIFSELSIYAQIGAGPMYFGIDSNELANKGFQFLDQFGLGFHFFFFDHVSFNLEYRFRHISNAGFREVNFGLNNNSITIGISRFY